MWPVTRVASAGGKAPLAAGAGERQALRRAVECALVCAADAAAAPPRLLAAAVLFLGCAADGEQPWSSGLRTRCHACSPRPSSSWAVRQMVSNLGA